ncbi:hypothetical protein Mccp14020TZ_02990 [Mycoplasma capricolum subsp. capripneumoniae]|nr:DUF285 domain-containing protein [Mycoplasma capricolum]WGD32793.1 hypothetical protein Mccp14020TZ_02990 [Mycoplasma capricolum subsp. capripneumoniae]
MYKNWFFYNNYIEEYQIQTFRKSTNEVPDHIPKFIGSLAYAFKANDNYRIKNLDKWDVSQITNIEGIFSDSYFYDMNLNNWDTSNVKNMKKAFYNSSFCCGDISEWSTSSVEDMSEMFSKTTNSINYDISTKYVSRIAYHNPSKKEGPYTINWIAWNVSDVKSMKGLFAGSWFGGSLESWDVSGITDDYDFFPDYIKVNWFDRERWPKNAKGRDPYFWENFSPHYLFE